MNYIDIHCHLGFPDYDQDREEVIAEMKRQKICAITVGVDLETSKKEIEIAEKHENIWACIGMHPEAAENDSFRSQDASHISLQEHSQPLFSEAEFKNLASHSKVVAIGECGLDYFRITGDVEKIKKSQRELFESQIDLAIEADKPLMLHIRPSDKIKFDAYYEALEILKRRFQESGGKLKGNAHFFVGNTDVLKNFLDIGFTVSFAGVATFTEEYNEVIKYAPLDSILSETDAPFVAPAPYRGKRNSPLYVPEIVKAMAEIKGENPDTVREALVANAQKVFKIQSPYS